MLDASQYLLGYNINKIINNNNNNVNNNYFVIQKYYCR